MYVGVGAMKTLVVARSALVAIGRDLAVTARLRGPKQDNGWPAGRFAGRSGRSSHPRHSSHPSRSQPTPTVQRIGNKFMGDDRI
jgi:hypothetical protein